MIKIGSLGHPQLNGIWRMPPLEIETLNYIGLLGGAINRVDAETIDAQIKSIKYGSGITLSAVTANIATVNGEAMISIPSIDLRPYVGFKVSIAAGGKTLVGWVKSAGTGETYLEKVLNGSVSTDTSNWTAGDSAISSVAGGQDGNCLQVANSGANFGYAYQQLVNGSGALFYFSAYFKSGTATGARLLIGTGPASGNLYNPGVTWTDVNWTQHTVRKTTASTNVTVSLYSWSDVNGQTSFWDTISALQVLTPSATGVTIVSASGGSTYNWTSNDGIDPNAASFTMTITRA